MTLRLLIALCLVLACQDTRETPNLTEQEKKVRLAEAEVVVERAKLALLRDSLDVRVAENIALGIPEAQARSVEEALIKVQETVVSAAETSLVHQRELLELMKATPR